METQLRDGAKEVQRGDVLRKLESDVPFEQAPLEEQVRRLRREVILLRDQLQWVSRAALDAQQVVKSHAHHPGSGEVFVPVNRGGGHPAEMQAGRRDLLA